MKRNIYIRNITVLLFILACITFTVSWYLKKQSIDVNGPVITTKGDIIKVSVLEKDINKTILKNVKATDKKDGDLSNKLVVEKISKMVDKKNKICNVTFAVCDSDRNVTKKTIKIKFLDYTPPRFVLEEPLVLDLGSNQTVKNLLHAKDDLEGDISKRVKILSSTMSTENEGNHVVTAQVTNKIGDTSKVKAPVVVKQKNDKEPKINLNGYVAYLKVGQHFSPLSYIKNVTDSNDNIIPISKVRIEKSSVKTTEPGFYAVEYSVKDREKIKGSVYLAVVVE